MDEALGDLPSVDRTVQETVSALIRFRRELREGGGAEAIDPFWSPKGRSVAGANAVKEIQKRNILPYETPIREGLVRWIGFLTEARIGLPLEIAWNEAALLPVGHLDHEPPRIVSFRDAIRGIVSARSEAESVRWLDAAAECAPPLASIARERRARSLEVWTRLDRNVEAAPLPISTATILTGAEAFLFATNDLAAELRAHHQRQGPWTAATAIAKAMARDATDGWPSRVGVRWLEELFAKHTRGLPIVLPKLPNPLGAASFVRVLEIWGGAFRRACPARSLPFCLAQEPEDVSATRCALLFGSLPTMTSFHRRVLGTGERTALAQVRSLTQSALFEARRIATVVLLAQPRGEEQFEELSFGLFGAPIDARFRGVWPTSFAGAETRVLALLTLLPHREQMIDRFDDDWFQNPEAFAHLRTLYSVPAREATTEWEPSAAAKALAHAFEKALG